MLLSDVFEQLTYGELKQQEVGGFVSGGVQLEDYPELISHINMGMTALYAKFPIKEKEVVIRQYASITTYHLDRKYSVSAADPDVTTRYIIDTVADPFLDDVMRIESVYDEAGVGIPLNDHDDDLSYFTPSYDSIQIPFPVDTNSTFIVYRAAHVPIPLDTTDATAVEVEVPIVLLEALLAYVASRVLGGRTGQEAVAESLNSLGKYERICAVVEEKNILRNAASNSNTRLETNGWV